eukprot:50846-Rhodomonas_salina.4
MGPERRSAATFGGNIEYRCPSRVCTARARSVPETPHRTLKQYRSTLSTGQGVGQYRGVRARRIDGRRALL